jgi:hypothetical protein
MGVYSKLAALHTALEQASPALCAEQITHQAELDNLAAASNQAKYHATVGYLAELDEILRHIEALEIRVGAYLHGDY